MTAIDRTAYPRFKRVVSSRELAEAFTPTTDEIEWARRRTEERAALRREATAQLTAVLARFDTAAPPTTNTATPTSDRRDRGEPAEQPG